jgi:hypothetical protein
MREEETGVDGLDVEEEKDEAEVEKDKAKEELVRNRAYLGRELLTWLLHRSESGDPLITFEKEPVTLLFAGRIVLRGIAGETTELIAKGALSPYSELVKAAIARGLLVHAGRVRIQHGERAYAVTLDAEHLDFRSVELPQVLSEEEDDKIAERLFLAEKLSAIVEALLAEFLRIRTSEAWRKKVVPALRSWTQPETKPAKQKR